MDKNNLIMVKLHENQQYLDACCDLLNDYWPRSKAARLHSLNKSNNNFPCNYILINCKDDQVIGHVNVHLEYRPDNKKTGYIESLIIHKDYRRKGLGKFMMNELEKILIDQQFKLLTLKTIDQLKFYQSIGFKIKYKKLALVIDKNRKRILEQQQSLNNPRNKVDNNLLDNSIILNHQSESNKNNVLPNNLLNNQQKQQLNNQLVGNFTNNPNYQIIESSIPPPLPEKTNQSNYLMEYFLEKSI